MHGIKTHLLGNGKKYRSKHQDQYRAVDKHTGKNEEYYYKKEQRIGLSPLIPSKKLAITSGILSHKAGGPCLQWLHASSLIPPGFQNLDADFGFPPVPTQEHGNEIKQRMIVLINICQMSDSEAIKPNPARK